MWFRRDLRIDDNAALYHALKTCRQVFCVFVFDRDILATLPRVDRRVEFIRDSLVDLDRQLAELGQQHGQSGSGLIVQHAWAHEALPALASSLSAEAVFANHDDEPRSLARDANVSRLLARDGRAFHSFKDHVIFERQEVLTLAGKPYSVFTPYKNAWLKKVDDFYLRAYPVQQHGAALAGRPLAHRSAVPALQDIGFEPSNLAELKIPTGSRGYPAV